MNRLNPSQLAETYASVAIDCCHAGASFSKAQRMLASRRWQQAEIAIKDGLDTLAKVVEALPRVEEPAYN